MFKISEGSFEMLPYVEVDITPGRFWFEWWFEVSYWNAKETCWVHDYECDGGGFGLWFVMRKAYETMQEVWLELAKKDL